MISRIRSKLHADRVFDQGRLRCAWYCPSACVIRSELAHFDATIFGEFIVELVHRVRALKGNDAASGLPMLEDPFPKGRAFRVAVFLISADKKESWNVAWIGLHLRKDRITDQTRRKSKHEFAPKWR